VPSAPASPCTAGAATPLATSATAPPHPDPRPSASGQPAPGSVSAPAAATPAPSAPESRCTAGATTRQGHSVTAPPTTRGSRLGRSARRGSGRALAPGPCTPAPSAPESRCTAGATTTRGRSGTGPTNPQGSRPSESAPPARGSGWPAPWPAVARSRRPAPSTAGATTTTASSVTGPRHPGPRRRRCRDFAKPRSPAPQAVASGTFG
jgi:hypothetical protein